MSETLPGEAGHSLAGQRIVVTGGTSGLGLGIVEALVTHRADVTVVARSAEVLYALSARLGVATRAGDIIDRDFARDVVDTVNPHVLILNAGATPSLRPIDQISWAEFSRAWDTDVQAALYWVQAALHRPLGSGSRVLLGSSGAAIAGSPLSGGYAAAKRMLWLMAGYANGLVAKAQLGITFQAVLPNQIIGGTGVGDAAAAAYAAARGISVAEFLEGFGPALPPSKYGELIAQLLTDPRHQAGTAYAFRGDRGIVPLDD